MATFIPNALGLVEIARSAEMEAALLTRAEEAAEAARGIAPVGQPPDEHPGQFRDSISAELGEKDGIPTGRILSDDSAAGYILFGTSDTPAHDTFRRAVETTGGIPL